MINLNVVHCEGLLPVTFNRGCHEGHVAAVKVPEKEIRESTRLELAQSP
jgi:hypothetical protein